MAGREQEFENPLTDAEGMTRHVQVSYLPDLVDGQVRGMYVQVADVTSRVEAERARDEAQLLFQISMANAPFGEALLTPGGATRYVNPALCQLLDRRCDELDSIDDCLHPEDRPAARRRWAELVDGSVPQLCAEERYLRPDGTVVWLQRNAVIAPGANGGADVVVCQLQDVTARRDAEAALARLATTDPLTGLHNRHALASRVAEHQAANPGVPVGMVFLDLDGFKSVNDIHGHAAGDEVLVAVARRLSERVSSPNCAYRLGGDEFLVLVLDATADGAVAALAEDVCAQATGIYPVEGATVPLTASVGWTFSSDDDVAHLIRRADVDMYGHKARRRG